MFDAYGVDMFQRVGGHGCFDGQGSGFVEVLAKFTPKRVQHGGVQRDALVVTAFSNVSSFFFFGTGATGVAGGFLLILSHWFT